MSRLNILALVTTVIVIANLAPDARAQFTISGTVTKPIVVPVDSVSIFLYDNNGNPLGIPPTHTNSFGFYSIPGIPAGTYGVGFNPHTSTGLLDTIVSPVVVNANVTVDITLQRGNILSGFVRDTLGAGIPNIDLNVFDQDSDTLIATPGDNSDTLGFYDVVIRDGTYRLRWRPVLGENLVPVEYEDVIITNDTTIDITMKPGFLVSGIVLDQSMSPVFNADFDFIISSTGQKIVTPGDNTDSVGFYDVFVPVGTYDIQLEAITADRLVPQELAGVSITKDTTFNFTLESGFLLSGTVTDSNSTPVFNADLDLKYTSTRVKLFTPGDNTDALGLYQIIVPSGQFNITYQPPVLSLLAPIQFDSVIISLDTVINVVVPDGVLLSGIVRNGSGIGVSGVDIDAKDPVTGVSIPLTGDHTNDTGAFSVVIVSGSYNLEIEPPKIRRLSALKINGFTITADTSILVQVDTGLAVSGTVRDSLNAIVPGVKVSAAESISGNKVFTPANKTDSLGLYEIILPPETYNLLYAPDTLSGISDSALLSNVIVVGDTIIDVSLAGGGNVPPVLSSIGHRFAFINIELFIPLSASDPNGTTPTIGAANLPPGAIVVDNNNGTGFFDWIPSLADTGVHTVTIFASDGSLADSELVNITVVDSSSCCVGLAGDVNFDGIDANIIDLTYLIDRIFRGGAAVPCPKEADLNGDGIPANIIDLTFLVDRIFRGGSAPGLCLP